YFRSIFKRKPPTSKEVGDRFEARVVKMLHNRMCFNIKRNVMVRDHNGNLSEIDIVYGLFRPTYVECKNYQLPVPLKDVAKFKEVLRLNGVSPRRGLFITSSSYTPRATTIGIRTVDGEQLRRMERWALWVGGAKFTFYVCLSIVGFGLFTQYH
ncbi:hypothetical protein SAMD00019534_106560, partial [Acytostelium subglobosum LB1]|uniref:hypothetical protein n=1 Tax=Acytostelium subglobosum LB1 TaxID=1410327 RepID=UPI000644F8AB